MLLLRRLAHDRAPLLLLLVGTGVLYTWGLSVSGYANAYYSAAAQAGAESWRAMFFGSLDASGAITVDKPPLALWPMALSVRCFGLSSWSILLPQAVEGVVTVGLLYACVRRTCRRTWPAVLAGVALALTPVSVLVFRYNNPDALLTLLLVGAAWATLRALESYRAAPWLMLAGSLVGLGFLTKMLEALVVLPALALTYAVHGRATLRRRLSHLVAAAAAVLVSAGWWVAVVQLWPAGSRPYVGGSPTNSVLELALGYNGVGRLTGSTGTTATTSGLGATNLARIGRTDVGSEVLWLLPAAVTLAVGAWLLLLRTRDADAARIRSALTLWSTWLLVTSVTFAAMAGIFHSYYTVLLVPALAALLAVGAWVAWERRRIRAVRTALAWTTGATTVLAVVILVAVGFGLRWTAVPTLAIGAVAVTLLRPRWGPARATAAIGVLAVVAGLAGPAVFAVETVRLPHVGSGPMAGPGHGASSTELVTVTGVIPESVASAMARDGDQYRWVAATLGARSAASYQLATGFPVIAIGGYKGTDPAPTLAQFARWAEARAIHWFVPSGTPGLAATQILAYVEARYAREMVAGRAMYDLTSPLPS